MTQNESALRLDSTQIEKHRTYLLRYATLQLRDAGAAEDAVQDTLIAALEGLDRFGGNSSLKTWLTGILKHKIIDHHRRQRLRQAQPITVEPVAGGGSSADTALIVNQALAALDDLARDVFLMREMAGLSYAEIAEACKLTPDAVRSRIHRARLELRNYLQQPITAARARPLRAGLR